jgi:hypothetical protein
MSNRLRVWAERVAVVLDELCYSSRFFARKAMDGVACLSDDTARTHRPGQHGDVAAKIGIVTELDFDVRDEVGKFDGLIGDWPL